MTGIDGSHWRRSSRSNDQGHCVEVTDNLSGSVGVRDSKDPDGPILAITPAGWTSFVSAVKRSPWRKAVDPTVRVTASRLRGTSAGWSAFGTRRIRRVRC
jgi:hypothetical protein